MKVNIKFFLRFLGIIIFIFILATKVSLIESLKILPNIIFKNLAIAISLHIFLLFIKAWRWYFIIRIQNIQCSLKRSILIYWAGLFAGIITPGRIGDFIKILYLKAEGYSIGKSSLGIVFDRFIDLLLLSFFGYLSLIYFSHFLFDQLIIVSLIILFGLLVIGLIIIKRKKAFEILRKIITRIVSPKIRYSLKGGVLDFYDDIKLINKNSYIIITFSSLLGSSVSFTLVYFLSRSLNLGLSFLTTSACISISVLITLIPISIAGIGTRDATLVALFNILGLKSESAIAFSMLLLSTNILTLIIGLVAWLLHPLRAVVSNGAKHKVFLL